MILEKLVPTLVRSFSLHPAGQNSQFLTTTLVAGSAGRCKSNCCEGMEPGDKTSDRTFSTSLERVKMMPSKLSTQVQNVA